MCGRSRSRKRAPRRRRPPPHQPCDQGSRDELAVRRRLFPDREEHDDRRRRVRARPRAGAARPASTRSMSPCASGSRRTASRLPKSVVLAQPLTVPDMNNGLTTSSVILAKALDPAPEQLTGQQQLEQPFTISGYRVMPSFGAPISQSGELLFVFFIYNEGVSRQRKAGSGRRVQLLPRGTKRSRLRSWRRSRSTRRRCRASSI